MGPFFQKKKPFVPFATPFYLLLECKILPIFFLYWFGLHLVDKDAWF
jgi:hypothetical protein